MKKTILIVFTSAMELGGIERSLIGLLDTIDYENYEVDLFLYGHHGPLFQYINDKVTLLNEYNELAYLRESFATKIKHKAYYSAFRRLVDGVRHIDNDISWKKILDKSLSQIDKEYDLALSFFLPFDLVREKVKARVKLGWIHTDYSTAENINIENLKRAYKGMNRIVAVSDSCKDTFLRVLPEYEKQTIVIENILSSSFIQKQAEEFSVDEEMIDDGSIKVLSIGRYTHAKNFDNIPEICSQILSMGIYLKWYIIGFGSDEELIRKKITEYSVEDHVILLGQKVNPYPYIKACDIYIQPSRYEGKCVAVREAQTLAKPVIITDFPTSNDQLEDGVDGVVVPLNNGECAVAIAKVLSDEEFQKILSQNCKNRDYTNTSEIRKLYKLIRYED